MRSLEYNYPDQGYTEISDQFLLGDNLLVAPVIEKGVNSREVIIPEGKWKYIDGQVIEGPTLINVDDDTIAIS